MVVLHSMHTSVCTVQKLTAANVGTSEEMEFPKPLDGGIY